MSIIVTAAVKGTFDAVAVGVEKYLAERVCHVLDFAVAQIKSGQSKKDEPVISVGALRKKLVARKPFYKKPMTVTVQGTFYPAILLSPGWWERNNPDVMGKETKWTDELQQWLFHGFEQWGPSWDINKLALDEAGYRILGQLGEGDEVDSLPVIIPGDKAREFKKEKLGNNIVLFLKITGMLYHRDDLPAHVRKTQNIPWSRIFNYCILLDEHSEKLDISPASGGPSVYSGYLWGCWGPKQKCNLNNPPTLKDVYFVWEHTNFVNPEAIKYNADCYLNKVEVLRKHLRDRGEDDNLMLLQKSCDLVPGTPTCNQEIFRSHVFGKAD